MHCSLAFKGAAATALILALAAPAWAASKNEIVQRKLLEQAQKAAEAMKAEAAQIQAALDAKGLQQPQVAPRDYILRDQDGKNKAIAQNLIRGDMLKNAGLSEAFASAADDLEVRTRTAQGVSGTAAAAGGIVAVGTAGGVVAAAAGGVSIVEGFMELVDAGHSLDDQARLAAAGKEAHGALNATAKDIADAIKIINMAQAIYGFKAMAASDRVLATGDIWTGLSLSFEKARKLLAADPNRNLNAVISQQQQAAVRQSLAAMSKGGGGHAAAPAAPRPAPPRCLCR